jgi:glyoxalase family protein
MTLGPFSGYSCACNYFAARASGGEMKLEGLHHITMITGDAQKNVEFYADVLGLRLVKKTVNFDQPEAYHLYFGDESGAPGSILTWFEFAGAGPGTPGIGDIHTLQLGVGSVEALDFWEKRLLSKGYGSKRGPETLRFRDYDGLQFELVVADDGNPPLRASHPEVPEEFAILGLEGARAYSAFAGVEEKVLTDTLGFTWLGDGEYRLDGDERHFHWAYDQASGYGEQGAGSVHHIAWASRDDDHLKWQQRVREAGGFATDVRDRDYFDAIYFREPRGVLFEIATMSPGFAVDEDADRLGEELRVPKMHEHRREQLQRTLAPVVNPRTTQRERSAA